MDDNLILLLALVSGFAIGAFLFGGLWFTVTRIVDSIIPAVWVVVCFFAHVSVTWIGYRCISSGDLQRLLICVLGFIAARIFVMHYTKRIDEKVLNLEKGSARETQS